ncbi:MAG: amino acid transporter, partial [Pseudomonadota bacterium]
RPPVSGDPPFKVICPARGYAILDLLVWPRRGEGAPHRARESAGRASRDDAGGAIVAHWGEASPTGRDSARRG